LADVEEFEKDVIEGKILINENLMNEFNELDEDIKAAESFLFSKGIDSNGRKIVVSD
jgi:hypothetical protein